MQRAPSTVPAVGGGDAAAGAHWPDAGEAEEDPLLNWAEVESDEDQHAGAGAAAQIATQPPASDALLFGDGGAASQGGELLNWVDDPDEDGDGDEEPAAVPDAEAGGHRGVAAAGIDGVLFDGVDLVKTITTRIYQQLGTS